MLKSTKNNFINLNKKLIQTQQLLIKQQYLTKLNIVKKGFKYFIGYQEYEIAKPLCIILPQMNGYIKYFENG